MKTYLLFFSFFIFALLPGCSSSERFTEKNETRNISFLKNVRLLITEEENEKEIRPASECFLFKEESKLKLITAGEVLNFSSSDEGISLNLGNDIIKADYFQLVPANSTSILKFNEMNLRGRLKIINCSNSIMVINTIDLESYLKGVIPREMPLGKGDENYEALKAFAICARTYTIQQLNSKKYFDLYVDVRDQVYGGVGVEKLISNSAVDETESMVLTYNGNPAKVFYSSTCGGKTEDAKNVFRVEDTPYLSTIEDGNHPYCVISHAFEWEEVYTPELFLERIKNNLSQKSQAWIDLVDYELEDVKIISRFESGRVDKLRIELLSAQAGEEKAITLEGNNIRWIIRTADNRSILKSIWFDISLDEKNNVTISGKGYGHGVGLCQYGAIGQSRAGINFREILSHYFPGTKISYLK